MSEGRGFVLVRGGGDLGTGIAHALVQAGERVVVQDLSRPTALRLTVAFASAALSSDRVTVEGVECEHCVTPPEVQVAWAAGRVALWTGHVRDLDLVPSVVVDARMRGLIGAVPETTIDDAALTIGVGPGFTAGENVHVVIESNRGPNLGNVITEGQAEEHTGRPGEVEGYREQRLLVAPCRGTFERTVGIGAFVEVDDEVGDVDGVPVIAHLAGMIRGLKLSGAEVAAGNKVGDVDPRRDPALLEKMTDKALAVGRGVVEALSLRRPPCT